MALTIQTNVASLESHKNLGRSQRALMSSFNKLSSGFRVNTAADDAAGLAVSESMKAQIRSYTVAERNAGDAISMAQTAEGALGEIHGVMGRLRELAVQAANGSLTDTDRGYLNTEFSLLQSEIARVQDGTKFNGVELIDYNGGTADTTTFQVGLNDDTNDQIDVDFRGIDLETIRDNTAVLISTQADAQAALADIDDAISAVSNARAGFGAAMNRMEVSINNTQTMRLNLSAANSRIRDVDVAEETSTMARNQVLAQAGVSILAQANQLPQLAFGLLQ
jgi:flagellin